MSLIATLNITLGAGGSCPIDITSLYEHCKTIPIYVGDQIMEPHKVDCAPQPDIICVTPTLPEPTTTKKPDHGCTKCAGGGPTSTPTGYNTVRPGPSRSATSSSSSVTATALPTPAFCDQPLLNLTTSLLGLNAVDLQLYLDLSGLLTGLLDTLGDTLSSVIGGLLGGSTPPASSPVPTAITGSYRPACGQTFGCTNGTTVGGATCGQSNATTAENCLADCQDAGILATLELGSLVNCLGVTVEDGVGVDDCLFVIGGREVLDLDLDLLQGGGDSLVRL